ncbi:hypothetical protein TNCV_4485321 [Trichonephila clavipes]|nr:hypothetical protein TNCV_4485321 [Trichonephila clavipes]
MRAKAYCGICDHWVLRCMGKKSLLGGQSEAKPPVFSPQENNVHLRPTIFTTEPTTPLQRKETSFWEKHVTGNGAPRKDTFDKNPVNISTPDVLEIRHRNIIQITDKRNRHN